jgi:magnesium transporter
MNNDILEDDVVDDVKVEDLSVEELKQQIESVEIDDAFEIYHELDKSTRKELDEVLDDEVLEDLEHIEVWPDDSAGHNMTTDLLTISGVYSVAQAAAELSELDTEREDNSRGGTTNQAYVYVVDKLDENIQKLLGYVTFRRLLLEQDRNRPISELMVPASEMKSASPLEDQEKVAKRITKNKLIALPIVDERGLLLGEITADDAADIAQEEFSEDMALQGGSSPLEKPYLETSSFSLWKKRVIWLLVLFAAELYTSSVLQSFEDELQALVTLSLFIPLITSVGGNSGAQITTTLVRAMSVEGVKLRHVGKVLRKEMGSGILVALVISIAGFIRALTLDVGQEVGIVVAIALFGTILWSSLISSLIPLLLKKIKLDPAILSGPAIATIVDGTSLLLYLSVAHIVLSL